MKLSVCTLWKCHPFTMFGYPIVTYTWPNRVNSGQSDRSISIKYPRSSWIGLSSRTLTPSMRSMRFPSRNSASVHSLSRHAGGVGARGTPLRGDNGGPGIIPWTEPPRGRAHPQDATQDRPRRRAAGRPGGLDGDRAGGDGLAPEGVPRGAHVPDERADRPGRGRCVLDDRLPDRRRGPGEGTGEPHRPLVPPAHPAVHRGPREPRVIEGRALLRIQGDPAGADHGGAGQPRPAGGPRPRSFGDEDVPQGRGG